MGKYERVQKQHAEAVYHFCLRATARRDAAETITREVFLSLRQHKAGIHPEKMQEWLLADAKRKSASYWRYELREAGRAERPQMTQPRREKRHSLITLFQECEELTSLQRVLVVLRIVHGLSKAEIGERMDMDASRVSVQLQIAMGLLETLISPDRDYQLFGDEVQANA